MDMNFVFLHMWNFDLVTFGELLEALAELPINWSSCHLPTWSKNVLVNNLWIYSLYYIRVEFVYVLYIFAQFNLNFCKMYKNSFDIWWSDTYVQRNMHLDLVNSYFIINEEIFNIEGGIIPKNLFELTKKYINLVNWPKEVGIIIPKLL